MTSKEQITRAQTSTNLGEKPVNELGDVDIIRAVGMAGQSNALGAYIWRWRYGGDQGSMRKVAEGLVGEGHPVLLVYRVMAHLANDVCPKCQGRGFEMMEGAPVLSDDICIDCRGGGRREIEGDQENALIETIKRMEQEMASAVMRKLATQLDL